MLKIVDLLTVFLEKPISGVNVKECCFEKVKVQYQVVWYY